MIIKNRDELLRGGNILGRNMVLEILEHALREVSFDKLVGETVHADDMLRIGQLSYDLREVDNVYVVGAGKQVSYMAAALERILGDRITDGLVIEKHGWGCTTNRIRTVKGGHPLPTEQSVDGAKEIKRLAQSADKDTLFIVCVSGGCTSLATLPPPGVSLEDVRNVFDSLLNAGAPIEDQNIVRTHLSELGGGKLSILLDRAQILGLIAIDEVSGLLWGPTVPDAATFEDAIKVLKKYDLWTKTPEAVRKYFQDALPTQETPKSSDFARSRLRVQNVAIADNSMLCNAAQTKARELNLSSEIITTSLEGEASAVGKVLGSIASEVEKSGTPLKPPCVIVAGGETTVTLDSHSGHGGRNQELALAAAQAIAGRRNVVIASLGTDGTDGPTDFAGAIIDNQTIARAKLAGLEIFESLRKHDSSTVLRKLGNAIQTNDTETNLMDLIIVYIG